MLCFANGRRPKRVIGIMAAILASLHMQTADDLFGTPQGSPRTDKLIAASIQWAEQIMRKIIVCFQDEEHCSWDGHRVATFSTDDA